MRRWTPVVLAAALGLAFALPALAQWKWRDKGGQTQYSDLPPPAGTADQDILLRPNSDKRRATTASVAASGASAAATSAPLLAPKGSEPELEARRRKAEQDEAAKKSAEDARQAAGRSENCASAKAQLRTIDSGIRMTRANEKGEREFLDDAARAAEAQRARAVIASDCK